MWSFRLRSKVIRCPKGNDYYAEITGNPLGFKWEILEEGWGGTLIGVSKGKSETLEESQESCETELDRIEREGDEK